MKRRLARLPDGSFSPRDLYEDIVDMAVHGRTVEEIIPTLVLPRSTIDRVLRSLAAMPVADVLRLHRSIETRALPRRYKIPEPRIDPRDTVPPRLRCVVHYPRWCDTCPLCQRAGAYRAVLDPEA